MSESQNAYQSLLSTWIQSSSDFWEKMLQNWMKTGKAAKQTDPDSDASRSRTQESFEAVLKTWQTLSTVANDPGAMEATSNLGRAMPIILTRIVQAGWQGFFSMQQQWLERSGRIQDTTQAYSFENLDREAVKAWREIYEKEFRQFFHVPQLGLGRVYQEKAGQALDKLNRFQTAFSEFMHLFFLPMDKSFKVLQDEISKLAEKGELPEDANVYYRMWIKILEGHYMQLFKSQEYLEVMGRTLETLEDFVATRDSIVQDMLKWMSVPNQRDMDDLHREIYRLKKKIRRLEKSQ